MAERDEFARFDEFDGDPSGRVVGGEWSGEGGSLLADRFVGWATPVRSLAVPMLVAAVVLAAVGYPVEGLVLAAACGAGMVAEAWAARRRRRRESERQREAAFFIASAGLDLPVLDVEPEDFDA